MCFIDLSTENMMIPWIYLCFNKEFDSQKAGSVWSGDQDREAKGGGNSLNSSRMPVAGTGLSTNINKSGVLLNNNNTLNQFDS
jgi:hypothetical protein